MSGFDWPALLKLGVTHLKLKPHEFWALTPSELKMMVGPLAAAPMGKTALSALMAQFPDTVKEPEDG